MWPGRTVAAVCRGPAAFSHTKAPDGSPLVKGRSVTGFANSEEVAIGLTHVVPFLVEDMLKENGGIYSKAADWQPHVIVDGNLITGQNPASAQGGGRAVLQGLAADAAPSKEHQQSTAAVADGVAHHRAGAVAQTVDSALSDWNNSEMRRILKATIGVLS